MAISHIFILKENAQLEVSLTPAGYEDFPLARQITREYDIPLSVALNIAHVVHNEVNEIEKMELILLFVNIYRRQSSANAA